MKDFAIEEMKHAASIMERIYYLGGNATTKANKPIIGDTLSEFAKNGLRAEEEALVLYRKILEASMEIGDWETYELFEKIYAAEEAHLFKFQEYVNMIDEAEGPEPPLSEWRKIFADDYMILNKDHAFVILSSLAGTLLVYAFIGNFILRVFFSATFFILMVLLQLTIFEKAEVSFSLKTKIISPKYLMLISFFVASLILIYVRQFS